MKRSLYLLVFVLAIATAYSVSQQAAPTAKPMQTDSQNARPNDDAKTPGAVAKDQSATGAKVGGPDAPAVPENANADDAALRTQVQQQFSTQGFNNVQVAVDAGKVTLTGSVPSKEDRKRAKELAKAVPGVKGVKEKLTIDANAPAASAASTTGSTAGTSAQQNTAGSISGNTTSASGTQSATPGASASTSVGTSTGTTTGGVSGAASASTPSSSTSQTTGQSSSTPTTGTVSGNTSTTGDAASMSGNSTPGTTAGATSGQTTGTTSATTGTTAGATSSGTTGSMTASETGDLQGKIENALKAEPTLSSSSLVVNVSGDSIELSGSVPSGKEKQTAKRIAQSFAGNRKVSDRITVTGNATPSSTAPQTQPQSNPQH
jgi:osmotically-inducible protein OsmY